jgi:hypothetical protein
MIGKDVAPIAADDSAPAPEPGRFGALIDELFAAHFHGAPAMRDTDAFNHVLKFRDLLKQRLAEQS